MLRRAAGLAVLTLAGLGLVAVPAQATYHLTKIREISGSSSDQAYIELQMYQPGQNLVSGHNLTFWDADAQVLGMPTPVQTIPLSGPNPPNGQSQRTILIGDSALAGRDFTVDLTPFFDQTQGGNLVFAGAVCFEAVPVDCVSWGAFTGAARLPDHATPYSQPLPVTFALNRSISRGCATLLEASDDTNNNASDFVAAPRAPRNNSVTPTEKACAPGVGVGGDPNTKIKKRPKNKSGDDSPTFKFKSDEINSTFKCKLDHKKSHKCKSPKTYHGLDPGKHTFKVDAIDADGNVDPTPAKDKFKVLP
jgi:hypothetical protein